jgi:hypothetical protein
VRIDGISGRIRPWANSGSAHALPAIERLAPLRAAGREPSLRDLAQAVIELRLSHGRAQVEDLRRASARSPAPPRAPERRDEVLAELPVALERVLDLGAAAPRPELLGGIADDGAEGFGLAIDALLESVAAALDDAGARALSVDMIG